MNFITKKCPYFEKKMAIIGYQIKGTTDFFAFEFFFHFNFFLLIILELYKFDIESSILY